MDTYKFLDANLAYRNSTIYPDTGKMITQSLLERHLQDSLPNVQEFYQIKKEYVMEWKERELVAAKSVKYMSAAYDKGSRLLPTLSVGDFVRVQNQTPSRTTKWDKSGRVTKDLGNRQYEIMMDGSRRVTMRNRRHLRRIPGKLVVLEEGEEKDDEIQDLRAPSSSASPASPASPASMDKLKPAVSADPKPEAVQPNPVQPEPTRSDPVISEPRRSGRSSVPPSRLEVTGNGKSYAAVISTGFTGKIALVGGKGCGPSVPIRRKSVHPSGGKTKARP